MFKPEEFAARFPASQRSEIEEYVDTCLRRGQLRIAEGRARWSQESIKAVHALYVAAGWSVELQPGHGILMQFHTPTGDEVTKP